MVKLLDRIGTACRRRRIGANTSRQKPSLRMATRAQTASRLLAERAVQRGRAPRSGTGWLSTRRLTMRWRLAALLPDISDGEVDGKAQQEHCEPR